MLTFVDFQKRSLEGPLMPVGEFDLLLSKKAREIVKRYGLRKLDTEKILADDATADAVFNAAVDFLAEVGVYNTDTQRIIQWTKEEVLEIANDYKTNPRVCTIGKNKDLVEIKPRTGKDTWAPVLLPAGGPIFDQKSFKACIKAYAQEEVVQGFTKAGNMAVVDGIPATKGMPGEVYCSIWEAEMQTEALTEAGRPDMFRGNVPTATSIGAILAGFGPGRYEPHNSMIGIHIMPEQKLDWDRLNTAYICERLGITPWSSAMSMVGGLCGGPGGAAMGVVANLLAQLSYGHGTWCSIGLNDMKGSSKTREVLTAYSAAYRAVERNIGVAVGSPCVDSVLVTSFEEAIVAGMGIVLATTASGAALNWFSGSSPLTARLHADVMKNIAGMSQEEVSPMINNILNKVAEMSEGKEANLPFGKQLFPATYDIETLKPHQDYLDAVKRAAEILKECGVPVSDTLVLD